jgi:hypothetical protein
MTSKPPLKILSVTGQITTPKTLETLGSSQLPYKAPQSFLGFVNHYRKVTQIWKDCCAPRKVGEWTRDETPFASGSVLSREHADGWHAVASLSRSITAPEKNFPIHELVQEVERHFLFGLEVTGYTNHCSLSTWETNTDLSGRKGRWNEVLCELPFKIMYHLGKRLSSLMQHREGQRMNYLMSLSSKILKLESVTCIRRRYWNFGFSWKSGNPRQGNFGQEEMGKLYWANSRREWVTSFSSTA